MNAIPTYIDPDAWAGFVEIRRKLKAPLTDRAAMLILRDLQAIKDAGHDPNAALDQSTMKGWRGVFQPKALEIERVQPNREESDRKMQEAEGKRLAEYIARTTGEKVRRVA